MPMLFMLVGVPGSGKSTWAKQYIDGLPCRDWWVIASSDLHIEEIARQKGTTYTEEFQFWAKHGQKECNKSVEEAIALNKNIIWDQTNLTKKSRAKKLAIIPKSYSKYFVFFRTPDPDELKRRLKTRPDKFIPESVMNSMIENMEEPEFSEGFIGSVYV